MTDTSIQKERPLSPHLQVYKPQITSISSILHRMAGVFFNVWIIPCDMGNGCIGRRT